MTAAIEHAPSAVHRGDDDLPWISDGRGTDVKVLVAKVREGLWIVRTRFEPGVRVQTHKHTGPVYAYTSTGAWHYLESEYVNRAGSFLYEPAGSTHTLVVPASNTEPTDVWFQIYGANLNLDDDGNVESVTDAASVLASYRRRCAKLGLGEPPVLTDEDSAA
ncbi:MAG: 2,4'-dihydroxyacetophenone dioxygenase family protein [Acidimicrobiia bacterium]